MTVSAKDVMTLRQRTGLGMMDCKKALLDAGGNMEQAEEILRATRKKEMEGRSERPAAQGRLAIRLADDRSAVTMVELNTETDFTARNDMVRDAAEKIAAIAMSQPAGPVAGNDEIAALVDNIRITTGENASYRRGHKLEGPHCGYYLHHDHQKGVIIALSGKVDDEVVGGICQHITAHVPTPIAVDESGIPESQLNEVREEAKREAEESGKPAEIVEKMVVGKVRKHVESVTLLNQKYVKDPEGKKSVKDLLPQGVSILGFVRYVVGLD